MSRIDGQVIISNTRFDNVSMAEAVERILQLVHKADTPQHVCTGNVDHLALLKEDAEFRAIYASAALVLADGMPIVWLSRLRPDTANLVERVAGSDLLLELCRASAWTGLKLFFLGGMPGAADAAKSILEERFPGVQICGTYCPPKEAFETPEEQEKIAKILRAKNPDVLLVGLGAPKQEKWIARHKMQLGVPVSIGIGGSFEMAAGMISRAPRLVQRTGMEWAWRLLQDPKRLYKRYICRDLPLLVGLVSEALKVRMGQQPSRPRPLIEEPHSTADGSKLNITTAPVRPTEPTEARLRK
ncbi:WecB/TagA/CpsF family glycosyltransferase [Armatimonas sp.]|uniref:WecB/TagA/CpsF family glycosyltransferase n=1 Tax=Armatimonas sp. TaxID=1872638 RepID=UPI00374CA422